MRLYGIRVEALFRAAVVAIGHFELLTDEDAGAVYFDGSDGLVAPPDLRVVDCTGQNLFIEVKSGRAGQPLKPLSMGSVDVEAGSRRRCASVIVEFTAGPPEEAAHETEKQGFAGIGPLSSIYSGIFNEATLSESGDVLQLDHEPIPGTIDALIPNNHWDRAERVLRLWLFQLGPRDDESASASPITRIFRDGHGCRVQSE